MRIIIIAFYILTLHVNAFSQDSFFTNADSFFKKHVKEGKVAYTKIKSDRNELNRLVDYIGSASIESWNARKKKAFYINAYNIIVIKSIVELYPIQSPLDSKGFFDEKKHLVAGENLTLNQLENEKLRAVYKDARIHFVLVCAAIGCPKLMNYAYKPEDVDSLLEERTKETLNDSYFIRVNEKDNTILVSEIFKWYKDDFLKDHSSVKEYVKSYLRNTSNISTYKLDYYSYDWNLNAQ